MSSVHRLEDGQVHLYEREYTDAELREVTPAEMIRWMNLKTFGVPKRARNSDTVRPMVRANSLAFWKKRQFHSLCRIACMDGGVGRMMGTLQNLQK